MAFFVAVCHYPINSQCTIHNAQLKDNAECFYNAECRISDKVHESGIACGQET
ncbi:MAG: hypothetical protein LBL66_07400 [Clostridiales bacterium]|nr:hypothetical protein [Clostridiales bacterium]